MRNARYIKIVEGNGNHAVYDRRRRLCRYYDDNANLTGTSEQFSHEDMLERAAGAVRGYARAENNDRRPMADPRYTRADYHSANRDRFDWGTS